MNFIFLIAYICLILPLYYFKGISKGIIFLLCLLFLTFLFLVRDPYAAADSVNYIDMAGDNIGNWIYIKDQSPIWWSINRFLADSLSLPPINVIQVLAVLPITLVGLTSIFFSAPYSLVVFLGSESFHLLSFNGMRQGMALGFIILGIGLYFYSSYFYRRKTLSNRIIYISSYFSLFLSAGCHPSALIYLLLICSSYVINIAIRAILKLRISRLSLLMFLFSFIIFTTFYLTRNEIAASGWNRIVSTFLSDNIKSSPIKYYIFSSYRILIMLVSGYFFLSTNLTSIKMMKQIKPIKTWVYNMICSYLPLLSLAVYSPVILSRFSHFCIIPTYFSILGLTKIKKKPPYLLCVILSVCGMLTYISPSVRFNLLG